MRWIQRSSLVVVLACMVACGGLESAGPGSAVPQAVEGPAAGAAPRNENAVREAVGVGEGSPQRVRLPLTPSMPTRGADPALVTIVEVGDFQCPFCARAAATMAELQREYPSELRFVWINHPLPFHEHAADAAEAAMEAFHQGGNGMFWRMHDLLMENPNALERADLDAYAAQVGANAVAFADAVAREKHQARIEQDVSLARALGASGTPAFFLNGRPITGARSFAAFAEVIDDEIARAHRLLEAGVASQDLYATFMEHALAAIPDENEGVDDEPAAPPDPQLVYNVPVGNSPTEGPADALVTIVEFGEFQCPYCGRVQSTLAELRTRYGADLRIVWRNNPLPFHPNAEPAAQMALEANTQGKFWEAHELLFQNQEHLDQASLIRYARQLGLRAASVTTAIETHRYHEIIDADAALARRLGANGVPSFYINGRELVGAQPAETFAALIDEELAKARQRVATGTPRASVYEETIRAGLQARPEVARRPRAAARPTPADDTVHNIPVPITAPTRGALHGRVTVQLFSDFQCPFCGRVEPTISQLLQEYGDRVTLVWRNFPLPFHENAMRAAEAATEVLAQGGVAKFWLYHDTLMQNQQDLDEAHLLRFATQLGGIDVGRMRRALTRHTHQAAIEVDMHAVEDLRIGTPTFFINGRMLSGARPIEDFRAAIDRALAESP